MTDLAMFEVTKNEITKQYSIPIKTTFDSFKKEIISDFGLSAKYIDIEFLLDRPIRTLGLFNVEPGVLPRSLDNYPLGRFGLKGRTVNITFQEISDYSPVKHNRGLINLSRRVGDKKENIEKPFNLDSETDFPTL